LDDIRRSGRILVAACLLVAVVLLIMFWPDDPLDRLAELVAYARSRPGIAVAGLAALQIVSSVFLAPVWPGLAAAGYLFGPLLGGAVGLLTTAAGAGTAFLVGRYLARENIQTHVAERPKLAALNRAVAEHGFRVAFLARASLVVPANLLNYALAVSTISGRTFILATALGLIPVAAIYAFLGASLARAGKAFRAEGIEIPPAAWAGLVCALVLLAGCWWVLRRRRHRRTPGRHGDA
jgi:uncharacterized membrane protein YdjX (TVP38/TMEM64 family)